jgi:hypothetical protein
MSLDIVQNYVDRARVLLQDQVAPYRYPDSDLVETLSEGIMEIRRLRPDILRKYLRTTLPSYSSADTTVAVDIDYQYRQALVYYICGQAQLRDEENTQDSRAAVFLNKFISQLLSIQS